MSSKASFWLLLRLVILLAAFLAQSSEGATYLDFRNNHIDFPPTTAPHPNAYCNLMMQWRGLARTSCKSTNTFIHQSERTIQNICRGRGVLDRGHLYSSTASFDLITCRNIGRFPRCNYIASRYYRPVQVACRDGLPVHFQCIC